MNKHPEINSYESGIIDVSKIIIGILLGVIVIIGVVFFIAKNDNKKTLPDQTSTNSSKSQSSGDTLDLSGQQLTTLPETVLSRKDISVLNLSNNQFKELPSGIARMTNLVELNVENNRLESLPPELGNMIWLKKLDISNNRLPSSQIDQIRSKLTSTEVKS